MGRGRGGGRGFDSMPRDVVVSKRLSKLLRHGAEKEGLKLGKGGYINLAEVLANRNIKTLDPRTSLSEIKSLVASNDKQRFSLIHISALESVKDSATDESNAVEHGDAGFAQRESDVDDPHGDDTDPSHYLIRANQGHSIKVEADDLLTPISIETNNVPTTVVHGTRHDHWSKILTSGGLKPMGRNHIHFAIGVPETLKSTISKDKDVVSDSDVATLTEEDPEPTVLSGMRNSSTILIFIDIKKALAQGVKFWMSQNNVVLSEGDDRGLVGLQFFERVEERGGRLLVKDGVVVAEAEKSHGGHSTGRGGRTGRGMRDGHGRGDGRPMRGVIPRDI